MSELENVIGDAVWDSHFISTLSLLERSTYRAYRGESLEVSIRIITVIKKLQEKIMLRDWSGVALILGRIK